MHLRTTLAALAIIGSATAVAAEGCVLDGGTAIPQIETMNQLILDSNYSEFAAAIVDSIGVDVAGSMGQIQQIFANGFSGCQTIAARRDIGGMVQMVVAFESDIGPLFLYWLGIENSAGFELLSFNLNTDLGVVMADLH